MSNSRGLSAPTRSLCALLTLGLLGLTPAMSIAQVGDGQQGSQGRATPSSGTTSLEAGEGSGASVEGSEEGSKKKGEGRRAQQADGEVPEEGGDGSSAGASAESGGDTEGAGASDEGAKRGGDEVEAEESKKPLSEQERREQAREADMFGAGEEVESTSGDKASAGGEEADREAEMFGGGEEVETNPRAGESGGAEESIGAKLDEREDPLTIGGFVFLRLDYNIAREGEVEDFRLRAPNFLDVYLDARPSPRLRAFARGRLLYDYTQAPQQEEESSGQGLGGDSEELEALVPGNFFTANGPTQVQLDQLWLKFDIARRVFVTVGRQPVRWGSGRFWNPTDFLNLQRLDPLALFDQRLGANLLKLHLPVESLGWNFYAIGQLTQANSLDKIGGALRAELLWGLTEIALSVALRKEQSTLTVNERVAQALDLPVDEPVEGLPLRFGADVSTGVLDPFELRLEMAFLHGVLDNYYRGEFNDQDLLANLTDGPEAFRRDDDWILQAVLGADATFGYNDNNDILVVGVEYFYNNAGYEDAELYPWLLLGGSFTPLYLGRHYAAAALSLPGPYSLDDHSFTLSTLGNLSDRSFLTRLDYGLSILTFLRFNAYVGLHWGNNGELNFGLGLPGVMGSAPIRTPQPLLDVGVGLRLSI